MASTGDDPAQDGGGATCETPPTPPDIYLVIARKTVGPMEGDDVRRLAAQGQVDATTLAWHPAMDEWQPIESLPEMRHLLSAAAPAEAPSVAPDAQRVFGPFINRVAAGAIDLVAWLAIVLIATWVFGFWPDLLGDDVDPRFEMGFNAVAAAIAALYFIVPMSRIGGGATLGYWLCRLRLVDERTSAPPDVLRTCLWYAVSLARLLGWPLYFTDRKRRMLHNILSGTLVLQAQPGGAT